MRSSTSSVHWIGTLLVLGACGGSSTSTVDGGGIVLDAGGPSDTGTAMNDTGAAMSDTGVVMSDTGVVMSDTGVGDSGAADATIDAATDASAPVACGDGAVAEGECEPPNTATCSDVCRPTVSAECYACETATACGDGSSPVEGDTSWPEGCASLVGTLPSGRSRQTVCYEVLDCMVTSGCYHSRGAESRADDCYCGDVMPTTSCQHAAVGEPNGACARLIEESLESDVPHLVLRRVLDAGYAGAWAIGRINCQMLLCSAECS